MIKTYINSINEKYPAIKTKKEEQELIQKYISKNDIEGMRNELVLRNVGLINIYGKKWKTLYSDDELASYGIEGLRNAAKSFDHTKNLRFSTYAGKCIRTSFHNHKRFHYDKKSGQTISLDQLIDKEDRDSVSLSVIMDNKVLEDIKTIKTVHEYVDNNEVFELFNFLALKTQLTTKQKTIVYEYIFENKSYREIGRLFNISHERVHQVVTKSIKQIRECIDTNHIEI